MIWESSYLWNPPIYNLIFQDISGLDCNNSHLWGVAIQVQHQVHGAHHLVDDGSQVNLQTGIRRCTEIPRKVLSAERTAGLGGSESETQNSEMTET